MKEVDSGVGQGSISRSETIIAMLVERPVGVKEGFKFTDMIRRYPIVMSFEYL